MKLEIDNLGEFLNTVGKPMSSFLKTPLSDKPILKITADKTSKVVCSTNDRMVEIFFPSTIITPGEAYIFSSDLTKLKSTYKKATLSKEGNEKIIIESNSKNRALSLSIDCVNAEGFIDIKRSKLVKTISDKIDLSEFTAILSKFRINPVLMPGDNSALVFSSKKLKSKNCLTALAYDSSRVLTYTDYASNMSFEEEFVVDLVDMSNTISILSSVVDKATLAFNKKFFLASGYNGDNERKINVIVNHLTYRNKAEEGRSVVNMANKSKAIMGFVVNNDFTEVLDNVIELAKLRSKVGNLDLQLNKNSLTISGSGPSSVYKEKMKVKGIGSGTVRIGSNMITDIAKLIPKKAMFKVNRNTIAIIGNDNGKEVFMVIPFISLSK